MSKQLRVFFALLFCFSASSCAHSFYYLPEIKGAGAMHANDGSIDYRVPPEGRPVLKMRMRTLGIEKVKDTQMVVIRVSFARPSGEPTPKHPEREYLQPGEQIMHVGKLDIKPAYIHTKAKKESVIELTGLANETIEFLFPLPKEVQGSDDVETILFHWSLHYGKNQTERQTARFDRYDARPQHAVDQYPNDPDYPYDVSPMPMPGWEVVQDPFWWPVVY